MLKPEVEHNLGDNRVDGAIEDPTLNGEGEVGQCKVGVASEEDVGNETIGATFPLCTKMLAVGVSNTAEISYRRERRPEAELGR